MTEAATITAETPPQPPRRFETQMILPFINSTVNVFSSMVGITPEIAKPRLKEGSGASFDVSGIIGFSGEILGSVVVSLQLQTASKLVAAMVGSDVDPTSPDFADAIGELTNMIAGGAKTNLGVLANITCPVVVIGASHVIARLTGVPCIVIPCHTPHGDFAIEVNIKPATKK